jgi:hypothetical protein
LAEKLCCVHTGRELSIVETFVNVVDGAYNREHNEASDDWRPIGREVAGTLRDQGYMLAGLITPL